jgi:tetratricopeptide (TPR) repeat protein
MRWSLLFAAIVIAGGLWAPAAADDKRDCLDHKDYEVRIKTCSEIILGEPRNPIAYHNRGSALQLKGELDRAIADFDKAIELKPDYASAYNRRGLVYAAKGDYAHALADVTRADELAPKTAPKQKVMSPPNRKTRPTAKAPAPAAEKVTNEASDGHPTWAPWNKAP